MAKYVSNARSLEELRAEFLSDLQRRIDTIDSICKHTSPSAAESARLTRAKQELISVLAFWSNINLKTRGNKNVR